jgi:hypothetical protein
LTKYVVYTLRQQFSRHGTPEAYFPFGSDEFSDFALKWEFDLITSSQSKCRAENAVKTAKRLMTQAADTGTDPLLAFLECCNTQTEVSDVTPTWVMFEYLDRRMRTPDNEAYSSQHQQRAADLQSAGGCH